MSDDDLLRRLREGSAGRPDGRYSFQGGGQVPTFRDRPGVPTAAFRPGNGQPQTQTVRQGEDKQGPTLVKYERDQNGDRPSAHEPPAQRTRADEGQAYEWKPPGYKDILFDLGLRVLEVGIAAAAYAIGEEVAYFFRRRRFHAKPKDRQ